MQENMETKMDSAKSKLVEVKDSAKDKLDTAQTAVKQKLGQAGRALKNVDLRQRIIDNPLPAMGIAIAAGALLGLVRAKPEPRSRLGGLFMTTVTALGIRYVREAAIKQLGVFAKGIISGEKSESFSDSAVEGGNVRYTPAL